MEKALQQTVVAQHLQSAHPSGGGEAYAVMLLIFHERRLLRRELLQHARNRCGPNVQLLRECSAGYALLFRAAQFQNRL